MAEILTPRCPLCDSEPAAVIAGGTQAFCSNADGCNVICWDQSKTLDENLPDTGFVRLPPMEEGSDEETL